MNHFSDNKTGEYDKCQMYDLSGMNNKIRGPFSSAINQRPSKLDLIPCAGKDVPEAEAWEFDTTEGIFSIVNDVSAEHSNDSIEKTRPNAALFQWHLVCERLPLLSTVQGSYMGGVFVGCIVFGWASDK